MTQQELEAIKERYERSKPHGIYTNPNEILPFVKHAHKDVGNLITAYERLQAENTALRDALRPFADRWEVFLKLADLTSPDLPKGIGADLDAFQQAHALLNGAAAMPTTEAAQGQGEESAG